MAQFGKAKFKHEYILQNSIFWTIKPCIRWKSMDVSEDYAIYIFMAEENRAKQETSAKQVASTISFLILNIRFQQQQWSSLRLSILLYLQQN
jgi:hypothetical protein